VGQLLKDSIEVWFYSLM